MRPTDFPDPVDLPDLPESLDSPDPLESLERPLSLSPSPLEPPENPETLVCYFSHFLLIHYPSFPWRFFISTSCRTARTPRSPWSSRKRRTPRPSRPEGSPWPRWSLWSGRSRWAPWSSRPRWTGRREGNLPQVLRYRWRSLLRGRNEALERLLRDLLSIDSFLPLLILTSRATLLNFTAPQTTSITLQSSHLPKCLSSLILNALSWLRFRCYYYYYLLILAPQRLSPIESRSPASPDPLINVLLLLFGVPCCHTRTGGLRGSLIHELPCGHLQCKSKRADREERYLSPSMLSLTFSSLCLSSSQPIPVHSLLSTAGKDNRFNVNGERERGRERDRGGWGRSDPMKKRERTGLPVSRYHIPSTITANSSLSLSAYPINVSRGGYRR